MRAAIILRGSMTQLDFIRAGEHVHDIAMGELVAPRVVGATM
jgi:hypothetical protein